MEKEKQIDDLMMSGFLSAVFSFAEEVVEQGSIRAMEVGESIFVFERAGNCIFAVQGDRESNILVLEFVLQKIVAEWEQRYGAKTEYLADVTTLFDPFEDDVKRIFQATPPEEMELEPKLREEKPISIPFLLKRAKKGLDKLVGAVISGNTPVIVIGDRARVELAVATLERFAPYNLQAIAWTDRRVETADLQGMAPAVLGKPAEHFVVLNIVLSKVVGGQSCKFTRQLLKDLEKLEESKALTLINAKLEPLTECVTECVELNKKGQLNQETFSRLIKKIDPQSIELLLNICKRMYPNAYPAIVEFYEHYMSDAGARLEAFLDDF